MASLPGETGIRGEHRRDPAGLDGDADGLAQAVRPEIEFMIAEGGGVIPHSAHEAQFTAGLARRGAERRTHAVVARVEHQHRTLTLRAAFRFAIKPASRAYPPRVVSSLSVNGV